MTDAELKHAEEYAGECGYPHGETITKMVSEIRRLRGLLKDSLLVQDGDVDAPLWHEHRAALRGEFPEVDG